VRDTTDCLGLLSATLHGQIVHTCNRVGLLKRFSVKFRHGLTNIHKG
jgi:hypothetical protein